MRQNSGTSTLSLPPPLLVATILLFVLRVGLTAYEKISPSAGQISIAWQSPSDTKSALLDDKPILYYFTSAGCLPCVVLESGPFRNRQIIEFINSNFVAIKVIDKQKEGGKNPELVSDLESKYNIMGFPTLLAAQADGSEINTETGSLSPIATLTFLKHSLHTAALKRAYMTYARGAFLKAADSLRLAATNLEDREQATEALLHANLCYMQANRTDIEQALLSQLDSLNIDKKSSHYQCLRYLRAEIDAAGLLDKIGIKVDAQTEAHYVIAMKLLTDSGNIQGAKENFHWVKNNGDKTERSYPFAMSQLRKLESMKQ